MDDPLTRQLQELADRTRRPIAAFLWVLRVLEHTRQRLRREGHVTAQELLEGQRELVVREYGPMAFEVLSHWGLRESRDVGDVVFAMVDAGLLGKTDEDDRADFDTGYDFHETFVENYPW
ncbi:MAG: hypothetical protein KC729_18820 [Candidatus Eisenbacteria bacterium]|uniref:Uncharacterized protein n=1 Tax=Eiseniibacteriota bacterium TaxID=2212470 RepID=A0A956M2I2_UNCEI|nr:hypothetical protein [Candidatus Eisenbacteria bacterium]